MARALIITAPPGRAAEVFQLDPITPAVVEGIVRQAIGDGWRPNVNVTTRLRLTRDRGRLEGG